MVEVELCQVFVVGFGNVVVVVGVYWCVGVDYFVLLVEVGYVVGVCEYDVFYVVFVCCFV